MRVAMAFRRWDIDKFAKEISNKQLLEWEGFMISEHYQSFKILTPEKLYLAMLAMTTANTVAKHPVNLRHFMLEDIFLSPQLRPIEELIEIQRKIYGKKK